MMGVKPKEQKLFYNFSLSEKIPNDHFLYRLDQILDLDFIYSLATTSDNYTRPGCMNSNGYFIRLALYLHQ